MCFVLLGASQMISESTYQAREPEYDRRDKPGGPCYCFDVYTDRRCPKDNMVVDADRYQAACATTCTVSNGSVVRAHLSANTRGKKVRPGSS